MKTRRRVCFFLALTTLPAVTTACSLAFSLDGYEGTRSDGGSSGAPGVTPPTSDAGASPDGSFCPPGALLCDDFERAATNLIGPWDAVDQQGGTLALVDGTPTGTALKVHVDANPDPSNGFAIVDLSKTLGASLTKAAITSRLLLSTASSTNGLHLNALVFTHGQASSSSFFPYLTVGNSITVGELECDPSITNGCTYSQAGVTKPLTLNTWHDVSFTVDFASTPPTLTLLLDGALLVSMKADPHAAKGTLAAQAAGAYIDPNHAAWDLMIDNVVVSGP